ncbi:MAG: aminotransferase class III-fold pyridoxal phosphate-dependent enzyme [Phycisphaerae bacterium]|nr:aminotransferase class III-fold pyridoxal phosphate-dependent enzyme [Phycisphaerae bacterium]
MNVTNANVSNPGWELWQKACRLIPGGGMLLSKRPELFCPEQWPTYFSRAEGCRVWDLAGREYIDMQMSVGQAILGYADPDVDAAVRRRIDRGVTTTLNTPDEVELAELLCEIFDCAEMVRFTRSGGEALAVAIRIARAHTGRDRIAFCGYHGWSDWYLAANLVGDDALNGHLLPGLAAEGVPKALAGTILPFEYNHPEQLQALLERYPNEFGAVIMEPIRQHEPDPEFLGTVKKLARQHGCVLIFDEVTVGFRYAMGGAEEVLGITGDMAVIAKAMSNGYAMGAVMGRREIMDSAQRTFISSSYWTEGIGPAAALATIRKLRALDAPKHFWRLGGRVRDGLKELIGRHGLQGRVVGRPPLPAFSLDYGDDSMPVSTLFAQEMLARGFLAGKGVPLSLAHDDRVIDQYLSALDETFAVIAEAVAKHDVTSRLRGPVAQSTFRRMA